MRALDRVLRRRQQMFDQRVETKVVEHTRRELVYPGLQQMRLVCAPD